MRTVNLKCRLYFSIADTVEFHAFCLETTTSIRVAYNSGTYECTLDKLCTPRKDAINLTVLSEEEYFQEMCAWDHELDIELVRFVQQYGIDRILEYENGTFTWDIDLEY